jgi:hypothetical protein
MKSFVLATVASFALSNYSYAYEQKRLTKICDVNDINCICFVIKNELGAVDLLYKKYADDCMLLALAHYSNDRPSRPIKIVDNGGSGSNAGNVDSNDNDSNGRGSDSRDSNDDDNDSDSRDSNDNDNDDSNGRDSHSDSDDR